MQPSDREHMSTYPALSVSNSLILVFINQWPLHSQETQCSPGADVFLQETTVSGKGTDLIADQKHTL